MGAGRSARGAPHRFRATPRFKWIIPLANGKSIGACDLQYEFIKWVEKRVDLEHPEKNKVLQDWKATIDTLAKDPLSLHDRLDWAAKYHLLDAFRAQENLDAGTARGCRASTSSTTCSSTTRASSSRSKMPAT